MARTPIAFNRTDTGYTISNVIWDLCKRISDSINVETSGSTLEEHGYGIYILNNPNITEDSTFSISISGEPSKYVGGVFSLSDGDIARDTTLTNVSLSMQSISGNVDDVVLDITNIDNNIINIDSSLSTIDTSIQSISGNIDIITNDIDSINLSLTDLTDEAFGKWIINPTAKTLTFYRSDGTTILKVFNLTEGSVNEVRPYVSRTPQ